MTAYRCSACGNKTRFDVVDSKRVRSFLHFTLGGELTVEDEEVLDHTVESVTCRWCGSSTAVETEVTSGVGPDDDRTEASSAEAFRSTVGPETRSQPGSES